MSIDAMRRNYEVGELTEEKAGDDPITLFRAWFEKAKDDNAGEWYEANAMTLATVDEAGMPDARIVLLKSIEDEGVVFFTNYTSTKGKQIESQPTVALVFHWASQERQVRIVGRASKVDRQTSEAYFATRPRGSQLGAWVSEQSEPTTRQALAERLDELEKRYEGKDVPCPPHWGGYLVEPLRMEFWQGRPNRLHDRLVYHKDGKGWRCERLSP